MEESYGQTTFFNQHQCTEKTVWQTVLAILIVLTDKLWLVNRSNLGAENEEIRVTFCLSNQNGNWRVVHLHISKPAE